MFQSTCLSLGVWDLCVRVASKIVDLHVLPPGEGFTCYSGGVTTFGVESVLRKKQLRYGTIPSSVGSLIFMKHWGNCFREASFFPVI